MSKEPQYHTLSIPITVQHYLHDQTIIYTQSTLDIWGERDVTCSSSSQNRLISKRHLLVEMVAISNNQNLSLSLKVWVYSFDH